MELDKRRLTQQMSVITEVEALNLTLPGARIEYTSHHDSYGDEDGGIAEDQICFNLRGNCGTWSGTFQDFERLCRMIRQLTEQRPQTWQTLGLSYTMWEDLQKFNDEASSQVPTSAINQVVRALRG